MIELLHQHIKSYFILNIFVIPQNGSKSLQSLRDVEMSW